MFSSAFPGPLKPALFWQRWVKEWETQTSLRTCHAVSTWHSGVCRIKHWAPPSLLLPLLLHLGLPLRDTVCQPVHAWPACHVPMPTQNTVLFTETWENPPILCTMRSGHRGGMQGNMALANGVKCLKKKTLIITCCILQFGWYVSVERKEKNWQGRRVWSNTQRSWNVSV